MFSGKTKRGVDIRSTRGMKEVARPTWLVVADRARVRIFEAADGAIRGVEQLDFPEGRMKERELGADRPGRSFDPHDSSHHGQTGATRHAFSKERSLEDQVVQRIASATVERLKEGLTERRFERCLLIAEPKLVGQLKPAFQDVAPAVPFLIHESDLCWVEGKELEERLRKILKAH